MLKKKVLKNVPIVYLSFQTQTHISGTWEDYAPLPNGICRTECHELCGVSSNNPTMTETILSLQHISLFGRESDLAWAQVFFARLGISCNRAAINGKIIPRHLLAAISEKQSSQQS